MTQNEVSDTLLPRDPEERASVLKAPFEIFFDSRWLPVTKWLGAGYTEVRDHRDVDPADIVACVAWDVKRHLLDGQGWLVLDIEKAPRAMATLLKRPRPGDRD